MNRRTLLQAALGLPVFRFLSRKKKEADHKIGIGTCNSKSFIHIQGPIEEILRVESNGDIIQNGKVINSDPDAVRDAFIRAAPIIMNFSALDPLVDDFTAKCQRCGDEYDIFEYSICPRCLRYLSLKAANTIDLVGSPLWYGNYWKEEQ